MTFALEAEARGDDLLWDPVTVSRDVRRIVPAVRPDPVNVDHFAFVLAPCSPNGPCDNATQRHTVWAVCRWGGSRGVVQTRAGVCRWARAAWACWCSSVSRAS